MLCSQCQCENLADASFCQGCGARLELICGGCDAANPPSSRFCRKCGVRLAPAPAVPAAAALEPTTSGVVSSEAPGGDPFVPPHLAERFRHAHAVHLAQHAGERKVITALFADIKDSMALLDEMDPERARQVIDPALRLMINAVYRYEGYVVQTLGDGILALFGAPIASEDHARRALYAALSMQEQMKEYGLRLQREEGLPAMQIRVGINTGEVVVRMIATDDQRADYQPVGHSTSLAARIESVAAPGSILVSESTHRLTQGYFEFRGLGSVPMKGVSANVNLYEVTGIGPLRTRLEVSASHGLSRFVGRRNELERLQAMLALAKSGQGQIVGVIGEAGIGKSRLCHEFKQWASNDCLVLECSSDSYGKAVPFLPLIELLKHYLQIAPGDDERQILEKATGRVRSLDESLDDTIPFLLALLGVADPANPINRMDPKIRRRRTFAAIQQLVLREALKQPVLMVIEDLHWLDGETQNFLTTFGGAVCDARILLLVNYRPEYQPAWDAATSHSQLRLKAFGPEEAETLLVALLETDIALNPLKRLIVDKTQGNPFFIEEYVQTLFDHGVLVRGEKIALTRALSTIDMPATVRGVLAARIDRLQPGHKALIRLLSVMGTACELRLIERLTSFPQSELQQMLSELQSAEFIYERPAFPDVEYVFKHALTRETVYAQLLADDKRSLHSRAAQAIEAHYSDRLDEYCSQLAHHYTCADNLSKAVDFLQCAGAQAMQRSAYAAAIDHLTSALTMLPSVSDAADRDARELQLQTMLGSMWMATRGFAVAEAGLAYERARALCRETTPSVDLISVLAGLGLLYINRGELRLARDTGEQLLSLAERRQEPELFVSGHQVLGLTLLRVGALNDCRLHMAQAVARCDGVDVGALRDRLGGDPAVTCLGFGALALWLSGYPDQALAQVAQALRAATAARRRHPFTLAYALLSSVWVHQFRREGSLALREASAAAEFATEQGFPTWLAHGVLVQGWAEAEQGKTESGIAHIEQALSAYKATGAKVWQPFYLLLHAQALSRAGRAAAALDAVTRALGLAQEMGAYWWDAELFRIRGELLLTVSAELGGEAQSCFEQALRIARAQGAKSLELRANVSMARLARQQDRRSTATAELSTAIEWFTEGFDVADLIEARELLQELS